jgi:hypothetical protein
MFYFLYVIISKKLFRLSKFIIKVLCDGLCYSMEMNISSFADLRGDLINSCLGYLNDDERLIFLKLKNQKIYKRLFNSFFKMNDKLNDLINLAFNKDGYDQNELYVMFEDVKLLLENDERPTYHLDVLNYLLKTKYFFKKEINFILNNPEKFQDISKTNLIYYVYCIQLYNSALNNHIESFNLIVKVPNSEVEIDLNFYTDHEICELIEGNASQEEKFQKCLKETRLCIRSIFGCKFTTKIEELRKKIHEGIYKKNILSKK